MVFIFGGAYQGKLEFARELFGADKTVFECTLEGKPAFAADIIYAYHTLILSLIRSGTDPCEYTRNSLDKLKSKIIICDDISSGVVPVEPEMRAWRESVGRCMGIISANSDRVYRVFCGIGTKIK